MLLGVGSSFAKSIQTWELGAEFSGIEYEEPGVMREDGVMYGVAGAWTNHHYGSMVRIEGKLSYGQVDYVGSGTIDNIDDLMLEFRMLGGKELPVSKSTVVTAYTGFGYRYLRDDISGKVSSTNKWGYLRESNYYYIPIGVEALARLEKGWSLGAVLEYDLFLWGKQLSYMSDVNSNYNDLEHNQNDGYGWRGSIRLRKKGRSREYAIEPFIRYWDIEQSDIQALFKNGVFKDYYVEPKNNSRELGIKLSVIF